jgi:hypothetical protein
MILKRLRSPVLNNIVSSLNPHSNGNNTLEKYYYLVQFLLSTGNRKCHLELKKNKLATGLMANHTFTHIYLKKFSAVKFIKRMINA